MSLANLAADNATVSSISSQRNLGKRCINCFQETLDVPCPYCGWIPGHPTRPPFIPVGTVLNNCYQIGRVLGDGGFGITYLAWDTNLNLPIAIKEYFPRDYATRIGDDLNLLRYVGPKRILFANGLLNFQEEARILAKFKGHPVIVEVYNLFKANETCYMVMEYVAGTTLRAYLKHKGLLSYKNTFKALTPIMSALQTVHDVGLLHRDVSPHNIYITQQKQIKLLDFGAAKLFNEKHNDDVSIILKPGYAPPEQYEANGNQGPWTDVYGLAATFYHCLTGELPPDAPTRTQQECLKLPSSLGILLPQRAEQALLKGLSLKITDRFQDIESFRLALTKSEVEDAHSLEQLTTNIQPVIKNAIPLQNLADQLLEDTRRLAMFLEKYEPSTIKMGLKAQELPILNANIKIIVNWIIRYQEH